VLFQVEIDDKLNKCTDGVVGGMIYMAYHHGSIDGRCLLRRSLYSASLFAMATSFSLSHTVGPDNQIDDLFVIRQRLYRSLGMKGKIGSQKKNLCRHLRSELLEGLAVIANEREFRYSVI
jgi:hypothetical protein